MQDSSDKKPAWGGKREGAGRKATVKGKYYGFHATPENELIIEAEEGPKAAFINKCVAFYAKSHA